MQRVHLWRWLYVKLTFLILSEFADLARTRSLLDPLLIFEVLIIVTLVNAFVTPLQLDFE